MGVSASLRVGRDGTTRDERSCMSDRIAAYRTAMLERKARAAGCSVAELLARGEREAAITRRASELRYARRTAWPTLGYHAARHSRSWVVL